MVMQTAKIGLGDIPPEIRLKIFRNCFVVGVAHLIGINHVHHSENMRCYRGRVCPKHKFVLLPGEKTVRATSQLLRTSKQIYQEGLPILYSENVFHLIDGRELNIFLERCGKDAGTFIRDVILSYHRDLSKEVYTPLFSAMPNMRTFNFYMGPWSHGLDGHLRRRDWGPLTVQTDPTMNEHLQYALQCIELDVTCLGKLHVKFPAIQCGYLVTEPLTLLGFKVPLYWNNDYGSTILRYNMYPLMAPRVSERTLRNRTKIL